MERKGAKPASLSMWILFAGLLSQNLVVPVMSSTNSYEEQKTYYPSPDPHAGTPPSGSYGSPPSHHHHGTPPSGGNCPTPSTPHHGGHGGHGTPPYHGGGSPPVVQTPPSVDPGTPSGGYYSPPYVGGSPPVVQTPPSVDPGTPSGGYYSPPTTPVVETPPTTPVVETPPSIDPGTPSGGGYYAPPTTPVVETPPTTPIIDPGTPTIPTPGTPLLPGTPFLPDPNANPFTGTCDYWRNHPALIWGVLGWWGTLGSAFGMPSLPTTSLPGSSLPGTTASSSLLEALSNQRTDGFGSLYREGTASFLNSMINNRFPYTTQQVRYNFVAGLSSNKAAASQAQVFKMANEGRLKPRA